MNKKIVHSVFESITTQFPTHIAVEFSGQRFQYASLNHHANKIAHALCEIGVIRNAIVGIFIHTSFDYIASVLGVLKSGGVFMPLDLDFPEKRLEFILNKTTPNVLIIQSQQEKTVIHLLETLNLTNPIHTILVLEENDSFRLLNLQKTPYQSLQADFPNTNLPLISEPDDSCYIIYTSGSTGEPKAILGQHKSLSHFIHWEIKEFQFNDTLKVSLFAPPTFDVSFRDIFVPLLAGGTLCIPNPDTRTNIRQLVQWMNESKLTLVHCVPSLFRLIMKEIESHASPSTLLSHLQFFLLAGEALYGSDVIRWHELMGDRVRLVNLYGPSETTLAKIFHRIEGTLPDKNSIIPLGNPISNTAILILKDNQLCRIGEIGEICIKTPFRSKGYVNAPELNTASFIKNPLTQDDQDIIYKTGDLGKYLPDRSIAFVGRLDGQVKINGIRIELSEIEKVLFLYHAIERPYVMAHKTKDYETRLICYYTEKQAIDISELRAWIKHYLPEYMIPTFFVRLDAFPLNINGKIDKKALPKPQDIIYAKIKYEKPKNATEEQLAQIWGDVLGLENIGVNNPFFEIGGNSLSAIRIISRIYKTFEIDISIQDFFTHATIRKLADIITQSDRKVYRNIKPIEIKDYYDVSHAQRRLWIIDQLERDLVHYNIPGASLLEGDIDAMGFHMAFKQLIDRHESLRTIFIVKDGEPKQKILSQIDFQLQEIDLCQTNDQDAIAKKIIEKESITSFDLSKGPLLRGLLVKLSPTKTILMINIHHIISDALSIDIMIQELMQFYMAYKDNKPADLQPLSIHYKEFAAWQNELLQTQEYDDHSAFWQEKLSGDLPVLNLPTDFPRPKIQRAKGASIRFELSNKAELLKIAEKNDASLFMIMTALFKTLFYRYTEQEDIILGTPISSRNHPDLERQIGFYVNMLPLRSTLNATDTFLDVLQTVRRTCIEAYDHLMYPFDKLVDELALARDMSRSPVFDIMIVLDSNEITTDWKTFEQIKVSDYRFDHFTTRYDMSFLMTDTNETLDIFIEYNTDLFREDRIHRMAHHIEELAKSIIHDPDQSIAHINILPTWEREKILGEFNNTYSDYPREHTIAWVFEEKVKQVPKSPAIVYEGTVLTYEELNACANQLAHILRNQLNLKHEDVVGIMLDKSERMVISILGILKAGGACMCIDPLYPADRIRFVVDDANCQIVLSEGEYLTHLKTICPQAHGLDVALFGTSHPEYNVNTPNPSPIGNGQSAAYIIYTSGSTGKPKGSIIEHRTPMRIVINTNYISIQPTDRFLQTCSFSFDVSLFDCWGTLLNGACLYMIPASALLEADKMKTYMMDYDINVMFMPTSLFNELSDADIEIFKNLNTLLVGGEKLSLAHINRIKMAYPTMNVINIYGPTENGTFTTCHVIPKIYERDIPVGKPVSGTEVIILDTNDEIVPIGVLGELCTSGDGLARGYLNRPELTKEKFVPHPFKPGELMYRIGDMTRWMPDGNIEYWGRTDDQVKIRGYRIELGEIQNRMVEHPAIRQSVVLDRFNPSSKTKELTAYYVCKEDITNPPDIFELRRFLGEFLPGYMIPAHFIHMKNFILNTNGKVDRNLLPSPEDAAMTDQVRIEPPRNDIEATLLKIWQRILGKKNIGINDNYFAIGGDSIKAIQIVSHLQEENLKIEVRDIFQEQSIAALSEKVVQLDRKIDQGTVTGLVPLSPVQCWFFDHYNHDRHHFNQAQLVISKEKFQTHALKSAIKKVQDHHDALRMTFTIKDTGEIIQMNCDTDYPVGFKTIDLCQVDDPEDRLTAYINNIQASLNLQTGPLMKVILFQLKNRDCMLIVLHHLVIDGISWRILANDILSAYTQYLKGESVQLPSKTHSYQYWSEQIQIYANSDKLLHEMAYWKAIETTFIKPLPREHDDESFSVMKDTHHIDIHLSEQETQMLLTQVNHAYNTEINDILLTALGRAMKSWHGDNRTLINLEGHGREEIPMVHAEGDTLDVSRTIGWFTSMYPVILEIPNTEDIGYQIKYVKESLRKIPNKGIGYHILKYITAQDSKKEMAFTSQPQISFNYLGQFNEDMGESFELATESTGDCISPNSECLYDLDINSIVIQEELQITITYNQKYYHPSTIEKIGNAFKNELKAIATHCVAIENTEITPSDIDYDGLDIEELDAVLESL